MSASATLPDPTALWGLDQVTCAGEARLTVPTGDYLEADDQVLAGRPAKAVEVLSDAGASVAVARAWVHAVFHRSRTVAVTIARSVGDGRSGPHLGAEWCWLVGADGTGWRVMTEPAPAKSARGAASWAGDGPATVTSVSQVDLTAIHEALQSALVPTDPSRSHGTAGAQRGGSQGRGGHQAGKIARVR